ncbi:MAG: LexA repressor [Patescibacteria group bacterium]|nr:MAG: LexA repressor [Patescibacteria group bacterium]
MKDLEEKLNKIKKFYFKNKRLPSYSEMLKIFGLSSKKSIFDLVNKFIEKGFLQKKDGKLSPTSLFFSLPVLGVIKAGFPIMADEQREYLSLEEYLIDDPNSSFLLKVKGDSLIEIGIFEGDFVVIKKTKIAYPGDVVLAEIDGEWTLKVFRKDKKGIPYLEPANPNYPLLYPKFKLDIFGVVQAVIRKMRN